MKNLSIPSAKKVREAILEIAHSGQTVHIPSAFSIVEIVRTLHEKLLRYPGNNPNSSDRDYLVLSKGHGVMALYPILEARGWIHQTNLKSYFQDGSLLPGLCEAAIPGCEANSGSLGQGVGVAVGLALASRLRRSDQVTVCIVGDGELNEGSAYESLSFAGHHHLANFVCIVDLNGFQAMGETDSVISQERIDVFFTSLGFDVQVLDGHDEVALERALLQVREPNRFKPLVIIAKTVKGKGVSFMENNNSWHYTRLSDETFGSAMSELAAIR